MHFVIHEVNTLIIPLVATFTAYSLQKDLRNQMLIRKISLKSVSVLEVVKLTKIIIEFILFILFIGFETSDFESY